MDRIHILLGDHHTLLRETLSSYLRSQPDMEIVGEAATADGVLQQSIVHCPDIVLLAISLPGKSGLSILPELRQHCPDTKVVVVTAHDEPSYLRAAIAAGATGYVVKTSSPTILLEAIQVVWQGQEFIDPSLRQHSIETKKTVRGPEMAPAARLSDRERLVLRLLAEGLRYQAIADKMGIRVKTVETYRSRLTAKLGLKSREDLVRFALESGILSASDPEPSK